MRLFVAEKKSQGEAIADGLGRVRVENGYIDCGEDWVTWCAGHLLEEYYPEDYNAAWANWKLDVLPMIPDAWKLKPKSTAQRQLSIIRDLLKKAEQAVNAGDPDREGQLLVDEVLEYFDYRGPVQRIWLDDGLTPSAVKAAVKKLVNNVEKAPLRDAARARTRADWLIGLNATRAMTLIGRAAGRQGLLPLGRVQTPTLALVVNRDKQIENFKPHRFYGLQALVTHPGGSEFTATFQPGENQTGLDEEGRLVDAGVAKAIRAAVQGASGTVLTSTREEKTSAPPLPYSLSALQKAASSQYGMSAQDVLDAAQSLYLAKLTSYPRSDCRYLPEDQHAEGAAILAELAKLAGPLEKVATMAATADASLRSAAWNSKKQTAHHGIIPTGICPVDAEAMPEKQRRIYELICSSYALQFHPPMRFEARTILLSCKETAWKATGRRILEAGWTRFKTSDVDDPDVSLLPDACEGDAVQCKTVSILPKMTTPPSRFSEGNLIEAMESVHKYVAEDAAKNMLRAHKGIGTEATRAGIIEGLKKRGLLAVEKKFLVSTPLGRQLIELVPDVVKNPVTTASWEAKLEDVAAGRLRLGDFLDQICGELPALLNAITSLTIKRMADAHPCPECNEPLKKFKSKTAGVFYWACFNESQHKSGKPVFFDDKDGKPVERKKFQCPECKGDLFSGKSKQGDPYFACFAKENHKDGKVKFFENKKGKPDLGGKKK